MRTAELDYELPPELVAQRPAERRDGARMLVVARRGLEDSRVADWPDRVTPGSLVVLNDSRVFRARVVGRRQATGGRVELLLLRPVADGSVAWEALGRANRPLAAGTEIVAGTLRARVVERGEGGTVIVALDADEAIDEAIAREGRVPLPPYVRREPDEADLDRYQTVYARVPGSVAAPTAGLHLTEEALARLAARDVAVARVTLHVGVGTFRPVSSETLEGHTMHEEWLEVSPDVAASVAAARDRGAPVVAVGTTVVRALESAADPARPERVLPFRGTTRLFLRPGRGPRIVDALLTNFHVPRSTLLALVAAFAGRERILEAYREAVRRQYRFLSYGDAMWLPERLS